MRDAHKEKQVPTTGAERIPYSTAEQIARGYLKHMTESFVGQITGAGGAGGTLADIPFEPAVVVLVNPGTLFQLSMPISGGRISINAISGAAAGTATPAATQDPTTKKWSLALPTGLAPDGDPVHVLCFGVSDIDGGL